VNDPTESHLALAHEFCRNWIASGHAVERMAVLLAEEYERGRLSALEALLTDESSLEVARSAIENTLIDFRDRRISIMGRGNGLVVREKDGTESSLMRLTVASALKIGLKAMAERALKGKP
jgi:hypothetical protein